MTTVAAPAAGSATAPAAPSNGATSASTEPAAGTSSAPQPPKQGESAQAKPPAQGEATQTKPPERRKYKLRKLDGAGDEELELDDTEIGRYVQKARVADKQRAEFEKHRQSWESERDGALADPLKFFRERGVDLIELGKQEAARAEELAKLDPVQRELAEARQQLQRYESEKAAAAKQAQADAEARELQEFTSREQQLYKSAMASSGRTPKTAAEAGYLMKLYADVREMAEYAGVPLTGEQLAAAGDRLELSRFTGMAKRLAASPEWRAKNMAAIKELAASLAGELDGPSLVELFSRPVAAKLARAQLEGFRKNPLPVVADPAPPVPQNGQQRVTQHNDNESLMGMLDRYG